VPTSCSQNAPSNLNNVFQITRCRAKIICLGVA
jgi:hypothetical protein